MLNLEKVKKLYEEAVIQAKHTPAIGCTLVGNCTTIHFGMLSRAREFFEPDVEFTIGSISLNDINYFDFTPEEFRSWEAGNTKPRYNLHAWLFLPQHNETIDLTLAATLNHAGKVPLPKEVTFLTSAEAMKHGIKYKPFANGDDLLCRLHLLRSGQGA